MVCSRLCGHILISLASSITHAVCESFLFEVRAKLAWEEPELTLLRVPSCAVGPRMSYSIKKGSSSISGKKVSKAAAATNDKRALAREQQ